MALVLSASDIPGEDTLSFLAKENPKTYRIWEPDFQVSGAAAPGWPKRRCFPGITRLKDSASQHLEADSEYPERDRAKCTLTSSSLALQQNCSFISAQDQYELSSVSCGDHSSVHFSAVKVLV